MALTKQNNYMDFKAKVKVKDFVINKNSTLSGT